jgi:hypothetical protein
MCRCNDTMDIRARCCYVNARKAFQTCPARIDTALFQLQNDVDTDRLVYKAKNRRNATKYVRAFLLKKIKLTRPDANKVIELYWEEKDEEARVEKDKVVNGIICNLCGNELPAHTIERHLDINDPIHMCPHL